MKSEKEWYEPEAESNDLAGEAFKAAVKKFASVLTRDDQKIVTANNATSLQDLQDIVAKARVKYEVSHKNETTKKWLGKIATRLQYYGTIMDVLVQHHPEYVALAWGAMKFLFVGLLNHDAVLSSLAKALSQIADALPRVELSTMLYPTERMKQAVMELYAYLIRFLIRAYDWYQESTLLHILHSITRPAELRYKDLIENISDCSLKVDRLALSGAQAEQRDMHKKIDVVIAKLEHSENNLAEMKGLMASYQSWNSAAALSTNQRLSDLQLSNMMTFLSDVPLINLPESFQYYVLMRNKRALTLRGRVIYPFWRSPKLQAWSRAQYSSLSMVRGTYHTRFDVRDFCVNVIEELHHARIAVLWVMKMSGEKATTQSISTIDLLKHLILQALRQNPTAQTGKSMALSCAKTQSLETEGEWFQLLESVLADFPNDVYIIIDLEAISSNMSPLPSTFSWPSVFLSLFRNLSNRGLKTRVKVLLLSYGSPLLLQPVQTHFLDCTVLVAKPTRGLVKHRGRLGARKRVLPLQPRRL